MAINYEIYNEMLKKASPQQLANQQTWNQTYAPQDTKLGGSIQQRSNTNVQPTAANSNVGKTVDQLQGEFLAAQKASQLGSLEAAYKNTMSSFGQQQKLLPEQYRQQRIGVDTNMQKQNRSFGEFMASRGLKSSGASAQGTIANSVAAQGATSQLRSEEMDAMNALRNQMLVAQTNYNADVAGVESGAAADLAKYQIEDLKTKEKESKQMALDTLGRFSKDYTQGIIDIKGDGDPSNDWQIPYLEAARSEKVAGIESSKAEQEAAQYESLMDIWKMTGQAPSGLEEYGIPAGTNTSDYKFKSAQLELDRYKATLSKSGGSGSGGSTGGSPSTTSQQSIEDKLGNVTQTEAERQLKLLEAKLESSVTAGNPSVALQTLMDNKDIIEYLKGPEYYQTIELKLRQAIQELAGDRYR